MPRHLYRELTNGQEDRVRGALLSIEKVIFGFFKQDAIFATARVEVVLRMDADATTKAF